jgi:hypothetical protein
MAVSIYPKMGAIAAVMAVNVGVPCALAHALEKVMSVATTGELERLLVKLGVAPFAGGGEVDWIKPDTLDRVNWQHMAKIAGEPLDPEAWEASYCKLPFARSQGAAHG